MASVKLYYIALLILSVGLINLPSSFCYEEDDNESFLTPEVLNDRNEAFIFENKKYILSNIRVTHEEARIVCASYAKGATLAILDTTKKAYFIATAISETRLDFDNLWIGAVLDEDNKKKQFKWLDGRIVDHKRLQEKNESHWVVRGKDLSESLITSRKCLAFARKFHMKPLYVDLHCNLLRPFICETDAVISGEISSENPVDLGGNRYTLYHGEVTWHEAVAYCREQRQQLATFLDMETVKKFGRLMLTARPSVEAAWIGGLFDNQISEWKWLSTSAIINGTENKKTRFPPWRQDVKTRKQSGCLLFDRHLAKYPVFLEARCERKRSFVCEQSVKQKKQAFALRGRKSTYIVFFMKKTWQSAKKECDKRKWQLVTATESKLHDIVTLMGEDFTEIKHIWIAGKLNKEGTNFMWVYDNKPLPNPKNIKTDGGAINHYPPLIDTKFSKAQKCLNMDRENHVDIIWYGLACNHTQYFICETSDKTVSTNSIFFEEDDENISEDSTEKHEEKHASKDKEDDDSDEQGVEERSLIKDAVEEKNSSKEKNNDKDHSEDKEKGGSDAMDVKQRSIEKHVLEEKHEEKNSSEVKDNVKDKEKNDSEDKEKNDSDEIDVKQRSIEKHVLEEKREEKNSSEVKDNVKDNKKNDSEDKEKNDSDEIDVKQRSIEKHVLEEEHEKKNSSEVKDNEKNDSEDKEKNNSDEIDVKQRSIEKHVLEEKHEENNSSKVKDNEKDDSEHKKNVDSDEIVVKQRNIERDALEEKHEEKNSSEVKDDVKDDEKDDSIPKDEIKYVPGEIDKEKDTSEEKIEEPDSSEEKDSGKDASEEKNKETPKN